MKAISTTRMDIFVYESRHVIDVELRLEYKFIDSLNAKWDYPEKMQFHQDFDERVWNSWGNAYMLEANGKSEFAKKYKERRWAFF